jgi:predicted PurR-regulated permease PerM
MRSTLDRPSKRERALKWSALGAAALLVFCLCLLILRPFFNVIAWSVVLAVAFYPVYQLLARKTRHVSLSAFITSVLVVLAIVFPLVFMGGMAVNQFVALGQWLQVTFGVPDGAGHPAALAWLMSHLHLDDVAVRTWVSQHAGDLAHTAGQYALSIASTVSGAIVSFFFMIFAVFLLIRDGAGIVAAIPDLLPIERTQTEALLERIRVAIYGSVYGILAIAAIEGSLCGVMFHVLGIPSAALWGMVSVFASVLPILGTAAVWGPGAVYLAATGHWISAIVLAVWGVVVVSNTGNLLRPRLVGDRVGLSELVTFFAMLGGLEMFGPLGIVLGPVVFATAAGIIDVLRDATSSSASEAITTPHDIL